MRGAPQLALVLAGVTAVAFRAGRRLTAGLRLRAYFQAWQEGDPSRLELLVTDDYAGHVHALAGTEERDRGELERALVAHAETFTESTFDIEDLVVDGNRVAARVCLRAKHGGDGADVQTYGLVLVHFSRGRIAEEWASWDYLGLARQLGIEVSVEAA